MVVLAVGRAPDFGAFEAHRRCHVHTNLSTGGIDTSSSWDLAVGETPSSVSTPLILTPEVEALRLDADFTHPAFRYYAERVTRTMLARYAAHRAVIGSQVDNERPAAAAQPRCLPAVRGPPAPPAWERGDPQPRMGPGLLFAPAGCRSAPRPEVHSQCLRAGPRHTGWTDSRSPTPRRLPSSHSRTSAAGPRSPPATPGVGRVTCVGTVPGRGTARVPAEWLASTPHSGWCTLSASVTMMTGTCPDGRRTRTWCTTGAGRRPTSAHPAS
uniref:beta-galactosidase n=1 Tax=Streptomyces alanosinicus TaxID=68171 RepID=UPI003570C033